jgi:hypothetical protein
VVQLAPNRVLRFLSPLRDAALADAAAADAKSRRDRIKNQIADIEAGKLGPDTTAKPLTREDMRKLMGMTKAQMLHCIRVAKIVEILGEEAFWREQDEEFEKLDKRQRRADRANSKRRLIKLLVERGEFP